MKRLGILFLLACFSVPAWGNTFVNGGFETGDFTGWTKGGGTWQSNPQNLTGPWTQTYNPTGDPARSAIVTPGTDTGGSATVRTPLDRVYDGNYAARINNYYYNYAYSTLSQTITDFTDSKIYIAWRAVLEEPSNVHSEVGAPKFSVTLKDTTTNSTLYDVHFDVYNATSQGVTWNSGTNVSGNIWKYNPWQYIEIDTSNFLHDTMQLSLAAFDCGWGGHGGYAYVDYVGSTRPNLPPTGVPEPGTLMLLGSGLAGVICTRRFRKY